MDEAEAREGGEMRAEDAEEGGVGGAGVEEEGELELGGREGVSLVDGEGGGKRMERG